MSGNQATSSPHVLTCPRRGLLCECLECKPPVCLCNLIRACHTESPEAVRVAFFNAMSVANEH